MVNPKTKELIIQFSKFVLVGVVNTGIDFIILNLLIRITGITTGIGIVVLNSISFTAAVVNSYFMNKYWTFGIKGETTKTVEASKFLLVSLIGLGINNGIVYGITDFISPLFSQIGPVFWVNIAKIVATGVALIWNFIGYKVFVFKKPVTQ